MAKFLKKKRKGTWSRELRPKTRYQNMFLKFQRKAIRSCRKKLKDMKNQGRVKSVKKRSCWRALSVFFFNYEFLFFCSIFLRICYRQISAPVVITNICPFLVPYHFFSVKCFFLKMTKTLARFANWSFENASMSPLKFAILEF